MNYFISYPRSGRIWQEHRMKLFLEKNYNIFQETFPGVFPPEAPVGPKHVWNCLSQILVGSHIGFAPVGGSGVMRFAMPLKKNKDIAYVLLRDTQKSVVSHYYYLKNRKNALGGNIPTELNQFITSEEYGVLRFCRYCEKINQLKRMVKEVRFIYYEDASDREFIYNIPKMMGLEDYVPTDEEIDYVYQNSIAKVNTSGTKHELGDEVVDYIHRTLKKNCQLEEYRERYIDVVSK